LKGGNPPPARRDHGDLAILDQNGKGLEYIVNRKADPRIPEPP